MKNKNPREALSRMYINCNDYDWNGTDLEDDKKLIEKNLEILEIFKKNSKIKELSGLYTKLSKIFICETNDKKQIELLEEWLDNE